MHAEDAAMEVTRNEFLKCCAAGACSCVAMIFARASQDRNVYP
jgi:hypothetical protein